MKRVLLTIAAIATVAASIVPAYAEPTVDCSIVTRANLAQCVLQNSTSGSHDG